METLQIFSLLFSKSAFLLLLAERECITRGPSSWSWLGRATSHTASLAGQLTLLIEQFYHFLISMVVWTRCWFWLRLAQLFEDAPASISEDYLERLSHIVGLSKINGRSVLRPPRRARKAHRARY